MLSHKLRNFAKPLAVISLGTACAFLPLALGVSALAIGFAESALGNRSN